MNTAIVLAGGTGSRLGEDIPKQYIEVGRKPIIMYCLEVFQKYAAIDEIVIVANSEWIPQVKLWTEEYNITKLVAIVPGGISRQHSVMNGLRWIKDQGAADDTVIFIHDAARPGVTNRILDALVDALKSADGALPVLPVKDTIYVSKDGSQVDNLLNRSELFAGQSPELFRLGQYLDATQDISDEELACIRGCSEGAYRRGFSVRLIPGDEMNYKITMKEDLDRFRAQIEK